MKKKNFQKSRLLVNCVVKVAFQKHFMILWIKQHSIDTKGFYQRFVYRKETE